ncbi:predicted protein [Streptomyces sp. SPB78]|nr:predicted protein [Streptomyces sp. SPB78]
MTPPPRRGVRRRAVLEPSTARAGSISSNRRTGGAGHTPSGSGARAAPLRGR